MLFDDFYIYGRLELPKMDGREVKPGVYLIGEPLARPDLGDNSLVCLANVLGNLCLVELKIRLTLSNSNKGY